MLCKSLQDHGFTVDPGAQILTIGVGVGDNRQEFKIHKAVLQRCTKYLKKALDSESGKKGFLFLNEENPATFQMLREWLYNGTLLGPQGDRQLTLTGGQVSVAPTSIAIRAMPPPAEVERLETDLRDRFDKHNLRLVMLYCLAEKYSIRVLMNVTVDAIQDGFHKYGTVFGPGMSTQIFKITQKGSKLRDLCVAANLLQMDRGCGQLRGEIMMASFMEPEYLAHLLAWTSRNFVMFGRREREGWDVCNRNEGFSILNRA